MATNPYSKQLELSEHTYELNEVIISGLYQDTTENSPHIIPMDKLKLACKSNISYENILTAVKESFPESKTNTDSDITAYWEVCHNLSYTDKLI